MSNIPNKQLFVNTRLGMYLSYRFIKRSSVWTNLLIITVLTLTFLNLTLVSGVLVGLVEGLIEAQHKRYSGDIIVSPLPERRYIENSSRVVSLAQSMDEFSALSERITAEGLIEANYEIRERYDNKINSANASFVGIDPFAEDVVTDLSSILVEGEYLSPNDYDKVLIGVQYLRQYQDYEAPGYRPLDNVGIGSKVRVTIGNIVREVTVKGIIKSKIDQVDRLIFFPEAQLRSIIGRIDGNDNEIAINLKKGSSINEVKKKMNESGMAELARVQTYQDVQSKFVKDVKETFSILGFFVSMISLAVAFITVFIVVFINVMTHRKYIGILQGIGVDSFAIKLAYVFQSIFFASCGIIVGNVLLFLVLKPYFSMNPIDFPLSDGILVASPLSTMIKSLLLIIATIVAGYIPARIVVRQKILDVILGR